MSPSHFNPVSYCKDYSLMQSQDVLNQDVTGGARSISALASRTLTMADPFMQILEGSSSLCEYTAQEKREIDDLASE